MSLKPCPVMGSLGKHIHLIRLLEEAQHMLRHTECIDRDATQCPACSLESEIETVLQEAKKNERVLR